MKSILAFFSELLVKKEEPIQLYEKEVVAEEKVVEEEKEEKEVEEEKVVEEEKEEVVEEDKYSLRLKNPNNYTSFEEENDSSDDSEIYNLKEKEKLEEKRKLDEIIENLVLDTVITECYFTSED